MSKEKITVECQGRSGEFEKGVAVGEALRHFFPESGRQILAAQQGGSVAELGEKIAENTTILPLTLADDEGRRIYERSLRFVMLLALKRNYPQSRVRIEHSIGHGVFVRLMDVKLQTRDVEKIQREMQEICRADMAFGKKVWTKEEASGYFARENQPDKVALLGERHFPTFTMYSLDGMWEYFYGAMVPSTGYVSVFSLVSYEGGFVLMLPTGENPGSPAKYVDRPRHNAAFRQSEKWCEILGVTNAADLDRMIEGGELRNFIRVNEALQDEAIGGIAGKIAENHRQIVLIAGPSSSGKTTFAARLSVHLQVLGFHPVPLSMDNYYVDRDKLPVEKDGTVDLEAISTLDIPLMKQHMQQLLQGKTVETPVYNFTTKRREKAGVPMHLGKGEMLVMEGIHGLNPSITEGLDSESREKIHRIFVSALTCINLDDHNRIRTTDVRLMRRIVRDNFFRSTTCKDTLAMWPSVRRGEEKWIFPYQEQADSVFNSALHYELPVLRHFVMKQLKQVEKDSPDYLLASRLRKTLNYFSDVPDEIMGEIPPTSLLREFIGGSSFDEKG